MSSFTPSLSTSSMIADRAFRARICAWRVRSSPGWRELEGVGETRVSEYGTPVMSSTYDVNHYMIMPVGCCFVWCGNPLSFPSSYWLKLREQSTENTTHLSVYFMNFPPKGGSIYKGNNKVEMTPDRPLHTQNCCDVDCNQCTHLFSGSTDIIHCTLPFGVQTTQIVVTIVTYFPAT